MPDCRGRCDRTGRRDKERPRCLIHSEPDKGSAKASWAAASSFNARRQMNLKVIHMGNECRGVVEPRCAPGQGYPRTHILYTDRWSRVTCKHCLRQRPNRVAAPSLKDKEIDMGSWNRLEDKQPKVNRAVWVLTRRMKKPEVRVFSLAEDLAHLDWTPGGVCKPDDLWC